MIDRLLNRVTRHRRLSLFWVLALIGTLGPWSWEALKRPFWLTSKDCRVASIHDGDTIRAECGSEQLQIRLHCLDAPELTQRPWGLESRDSLRSLIPSGTDIRLRIKDTDRYGRQVAEVYTGDTNINLKMVKAGQAAVYTPYCHDSLYFTAETSARETRLGIWNKPGMQQTPWNYRHTD